MDPETFTPDFTDADVFLDPQGDQWRLTIIAMPKNTILTKDVFPDVWLADARAQDFQRLMHKHWPSVRVHPKYQRPRPQP